MFLKKGRIKKGNRVWRIMIGDKKKNPIAVNVMFHNHSYMNNKDYYRVFVPHLFHELFSNSYDYKLFMEGYTVKNRKFIKFDMAYDTIRNYYRKLFNILAKDPDINIARIEQDEIDLIDKYLPDSGSKKIIMSKIKRNLN